MHGAPAPRAAVEPPLAGGRPHRVPGLVDAHVHLLLGGILLTRTDLRRARDRSEFEAAVAEAHARLPAGDWLVAWGWDESRLGAMPDRTWLAAAGVRPAVAWRIDQHACVVNDAVLSLLDGCACPAGGEIRTAADGRPSGVLAEAAAWELVNPRIPRPGIEQRREALLAAAQHAVAAGATTVGTMEYLEDVLQVYEPLRRRLPLRIRVTLLDREWPLDVSMAERLQGDDRLSIIGFKAFVDGTLGSRTARMLEPWSDAPESRGLLVELAAQGVLPQWVARVVESGGSPSIHAIGDEAARVALDAMESGDPGRHGRLEHMQTVHPEDVRRTEGRFVSIQPSHRPMDLQPALSRLGPRRMERFFPFRAMADAGAVLALGSDWPIAPLDPVATMHAAIVPPEDPAAQPAWSGCLTPAEALRASTVNARQALCAPADEPDWTLLGADPLTCAWRAGPPRVLATVVDGRCVHAVNEAARALADARSDARQEARS